MNREQTKQAIEVMQAWLDGTELEMRPLGSTKPWISPGRVTDDPGWDWEQMEYRIKPEPREFWVHKDILQDSVMAAPTLDNVQPKFHDSWIKVREVLDED